MKEPYRITPMHHWHLRHGARMAMSQGWLRAELYTSVEEELSVSRAGVAICDVTPITKMLVEGDRSAEFLQQIFEISMPPIGEIIMCGPRNLIILARLVSDKFILLAEAHERDNLLRLLKGSLTEQLCVHVNDVTSSYAAIRIVGPVSRSLLKKVGAAPVEHLVPGNCVQIPTARVWSLLLHQQPPPGSSWLLVISRDYGEYVWESILHSGREFGIRPIGRIADLTLAGEEVHNVAAI
jgi:glycine cleavage system aminomethyltransferase T